MKSEVLELIAFLISVSAFAYGALRLFKPGKPFYFQLLVCACGCYVLEELWSIINIVCGIPGGGLITVRLVGIFGCFCFMLSANAGQFDNFLDADFPRDERFRFPALLIPAVLVIMYVPYGMELISAGQYGALVITALVLLPAIPASYFNLKHLLLPMDEAGLLRATRAVDVLSLLFYFLNFMFVFPFLREVSVIFDSASILCALLMAGLVYVSERGTAKWEALT